MTMTALATATNAPARSLWRFAEGETQLNHGSFGGVPVAILNAQQALKDEMEGDPVRWFCTLPDRVARARVEIASILGVPSDRLAMVPNASAGMSVVYSSMAGRERVNVMTTNHGYGAVVMGAERLARRTGGHSATVAIPLGASDEDIVGRVDDALSSNPTDLLVIDQITSGSARLLPTGKICDVAHDHGAVIAIDGAHAPGVLSEPVEEKADFWVGNLHKFWCAPRGAAVLVRNNPDLEVMPLIDSWGARDPFPARFDYQGTLDSTAWLVSPTAWNYLDETVGWPRIHDYSTQLATYAVTIVSDALARHGVGSPVPDVGHPVGPMRLLEIPRRPGGRAWDHDSVDALRVPFLDASGIALAFTEFEGQGYMRISTHAYTTAADVEHLADHGVPILADLIRKL